MVKTDVPQVSMRAERLLGLQESAINSAQEGDGSCRAVGSHALAAVVVGLGLVATGLDFPSRVGLCHDCGCDRGFGLLDATALVGSSRQQQPQGQT